MNWGIRAIRRGAIVGQIIRTIQNLGWLALAIVVVSLMLYQTARERELE